MTEEAVREEAVTEEAVRWGAVTEEALRVGAEAEAVKAEVVKVVKVVVATLVEMGAVARERVRVVETVVVRR